MPQSAAMPSPFPPIADYAFLSNCHTGALVAPDGAIDWLCVPRFDSPSIFGTLLDREAGSFRFAPFGINVPSSRIYEPGTNILNTTWHTPTGWAMVRDALTIGPTQHEGRGHPAYARARRRGRPSHARANGALPGRLGRHGAALRAGFRLRADAWGSGRCTDAHTADASGAGPTVRLRSSMPLGVEGGSGAGAAHASEGRAGLLLALLGRGARLAGGHGRGQRAHGRDHRILAHAGSPRPGCRTTASGRRSRARP